MSQNFSVKILSRQEKVLTTLENLSGASTIADIKNAYEKKAPKYYKDRQSFRLEPRGKMLKDSDTLSSVGNPKSLYFKDLGPQIGWTTVFLTEYSGPLFAYLLFYLRPSIIYSESNAPTHPVVTIAMYCWVGHYAKRLLETVFVHRFSHGTMPILNIFKNSFYYWGFAAYVSYYINHPLYTPPAYGTTQIYLGLAGFLICELGNLSIHVALRNLRPKGSKERRIPFPTSNPFTFLFNFVSCPNYTYEIGSWFFFTIMTQSLPAGLFMFAGFYQMAVWAAGKHRNYKREFKNYPRGRKPIIPFLM